MSVLNPLWVYEVWPHNFILNLLSYQSPLTGIHHKMLTNRDDWKHRHRYLHPNLKLDGNSIDINGPIVNREEIFVVYRLLLVIFTHPPAHDQNKSVYKSTVPASTNPFQEARRHLKPGASITRKSTPCIPGKHYFNYYQDNNMQICDPCRRARTDCGAGDRKSVV